MVETSLRERSKARRRLAIAEAARSLFAEHGYEETTLAHVADRAEVAPRTISLYFPSKLDLALAYTSDAAVRFAEIAASRANDAVLEIFRRWLEVELTVHEKERLQHRSMLTANPSLRGVPTDAILRAKRITGRQLARDLGRAPDDPVVAIVGGAMDGVLTAMLALDPDVDSAEALKVAIRLLKAASRSAHAGAGQTDVSAARRRSASA